MVQIVTSMKNTFVHAEVDGADYLELGSNARRRASSTPARVTLDTVENEKCAAYVFRAHGLKEFPLLLPHDDDDYASMHVHPGPSPLEMDVEGMLGCRVLETDMEDHFGRLSVSEPTGEATPDFVHESMDIDDALSEDMKDNSAFAPDYHGLTYGTQVPSDINRESLTQSLLCLNAAPMTPHEPAQCQLFSTSPIPPREEQIDSRTQSNSRNAPAGELCNANHEETQDEEKRTTVMLMNVPLRYANSKLKCTIDSEGFASMYDFIYVPMATARTSKGYAFVNLVNPPIAQRFVNAFNGFTRWSTPSKNICNADWAKQHQGLQANVDRCRNSTVLGKIVPNEYRPRIFQHGAQVPFPPPNRKTSMPTAR